MNKDNNELAAIFDMDGVLIDTVLLHWNAYNDILQGEYGVRVEDKDLVSLVGMSLQEQVPLLNDRFNIDIDSDDFVKKANIQKELAMQHISPKEGVVELLKELRDAGFALGVGTSTSRITAEKRLKSIGIYEYFSVIVGEEDVKNHKPSPDVYLLVAGKLNVLPVNSVVFEDAPNGLIAAQSAGMNSIAITSSYADQDDLKDADTVVNNLSDVTTDTVVALINNINQER